jgi:hypothetical protein
MAKWFRFYDDVMHDPKILRLTPEDYRGWTFLLCMASKNRGRLPVAADIALEWRCDENDVVTLLERLANGGLIDRRNGGPNGWYYSPHNWEKFQYKSDTSAERTRAYRERHRDVTVTPPDYRLQTTDTEIKEEASLPRKNAAGGSSPAAEILSFPKAKKTPAKRRTTIPDDWNCGGGDYIRILLDAGYSIDDIVKVSKAFKDHHKAKGTLMLDWDAAWNTWQRNELKFRAERRR